MPSFLSRLAKPEGASRPRTQSESGVGGDSVRLYVTSDSDSESTHQAVQSTAAAAAQAAATAPSASSSQASMGSRRATSSSHGRPMDRHALSNYYQRRSLTEDDQNYYYEDLPTPTVPPPVPSPRSRPSTLATIPSERSTTSERPNTSSSLSTAQQVKERYISGRSPSYTNLHQTSSTPSAMTTEFGEQPTLQRQETTLSLIPPVPPLPDVTPSTSAALSPNGIARKDTKGPSPWRKPSKGPEGGIAGAIAASGMAIASGSTLTPLVQSPKMMKRSPSQMSVASTNGNGNGILDGPLVPNGMLRGRGSTLSGPNPRETSGESEVDVEESETDDASRFFLDEEAMPVTGFAVASSKRNIEFHELFPQVPSDDYLIEDYGCALQREILVQGRLYISENHLCFYANLFGWVSNEVIPFTEVVSLDKRMTALIIPNAIAIATRQKTYTFASFMSRDTTYDVMHNIWRLARPTEVESPTRVSLEDNAAILDATGAGGGAAPVRRLTTCACGANKEHYPTVCMDATVLGTPDKIYNLLFASGFYKDFLRDDQKLTEVQISDWAPVTPGSTLLGRNMSYIKPLSGPIGPKSTRCELKDEMIHYDPEVYITMLTTTRTPEVPSGSAFNVKSRTCITWAGACAARVVVTSAVEWTGSSFIKGIITSSAMDGQKKYYADLEPAARAYINEHRTEFVPEGMDAEPAQPGELVTAAEEGPATGGAGGAKEKPDERWLQWALDTFSGASKVAQESASGALELLWDVPLDTRAVLLLVIVVLVATNIASLLAVRNHAPASPPKPNDAKSEIIETLRTIAEEMRRVPPAYPAHHQPVSGEWRDETADIARALDGLEERVRRLRLALPQQDPPPPLPPHREL